MWTAGKFTFLHVSRDMRGSMKQFERLQKLNLDYMAQYDHQDDHFFPHPRHAMPTLLNWDFTVVHVTPRNMGWYHRIEGNSSPGRCLNNHYHLGCNMWVSSELWLLLLGVEWWFIQWLSGVWLVGSNVCTFPSIGKPPPASTNKQLGSVEWLSRNPTLTWRFLGQIYVGVFCYHLLRDYGP